MRHLHGLRGGRTSFQPWNECPPLGTKVSQWSRSLHRWLQLRLPVTKEWWGCYQVVSCHRYQAVDFSAESKLETCVYIYIYIYIFIYLFIYLNIITGILWGQEYMYVSIWVCGCETWSSNVKMMKAINLCLCFLFWY